MEFPVHILSFYIPLTIGVTLVIVFRDKLAK